SVRGSERLADLSTYTTSSSHLLLLLLLQFPFDHTFYNLPKLHTNITHNMDKYPSVEQLDGEQGNFEIQDIDGLTFEERENQLLGKDHEFSEQVATNENGNAGYDDLLGGGDDEPVEEIDQFQSSFPEVDASGQNERVAPGGTITGSGAPFPPTGYQSPPQAEDEGDAVREWREKRDAEIARRAQVSAEKKDSTVKKAQEDIDDFYVSYNNKADKHRAQTKAEAEQFLANREDTSAGGTSWERIAKLVDVSGKGNAGGASGSGKERFRELLIDLRKDQEAPGASGI
ncbi:Clathrin light chain, partial [Penicillium odoratum]|uniref:Clathrin light chain n=1 Tax=Penicillium odoratum TaxID=1167516 RepID=UPI002546CC97